MDSIKICIWMSRPTFSNLMHRLFKAGVGNNFSEPHLKYNSILETIRRINIFHSKQKIRSAETWWVFFTVCDIKSVLGNTKTDFLQGDLFLTWSFRSSNRVPITNGVESIHLASSCPCFFPSTFPNNRLFSRELDLHIM